MKRLLIVLTFLCVLLCSAARSQVPASDETDRFGRPIFDASGRQIFYSEAESLNIQSTQGVQGSLVAPQIVAAGTFANPNTPFWSYGIIGTQIGAAGMFALQTANGTELFVAATPNTGFGPNLFWYVLRRNPVTNNYDFTHVELPYSQTLVGLQPANVVGGVESEVVAGLANGQFYFYDASTRELVGSVKLPVTVNAFAMRDLDSDGVAELIVLTGSTLEVYKVDGTRLLQVTGPSGSALVIGQMDADNAWEAATQSGHVVDLTSGSVQWSYGAAFGPHLRTADVDGDGMDELIAGESWYNIRCFDVDLKVVKWSYRSYLDIGSMEVGDLDGDAKKELIYGDNQHGSVHVLKMTGTGAGEIWSASNPSSGVPRIAVADADGDNALELLWGAGSNTTGADYLSILNPVTRAVKWVSVPLDGPFVSPVLGDVTGDSRPELVTACNESQSGYGSGRILVFDAETLALLGMSAPIVGNSAWTGLHDLKLADLNADGKKEILVASDNLYDGWLEAYSFTSGTAITRIWNNSYHPSGSPFSQVAVLDIEGDGTLEMVAGNYMAHTGSEGIYVRILSYPGGAELWRSPILSNGWTGVSSMAVGDVDGDGSPEAVAVISGASLWVIDLKKRAVDYTETGAFRSALIHPGYEGFLVGMNDGTVCRYGKSDNSFGKLETWKLSNAPILGMTAGPSQSLVLSSGSSFTFCPNTTTATWQSLPVSSASGQVAISGTGADLALYGSFSAGVAGFDVGQWESLDAVLSLSGSGQLREKSLNVATLTVSRLTLGSADLTVYFSLEGSAGAGQDYTVEGATAVSSGTWSVLIPAGQLSANVKLRVMNDSQYEDAEQIRATLVSGIGYQVSSPSQWTIPIAADDVTVSISGGGPIMEANLNGSSAFTFERQVATQSAMTVYFQLGGSATLGQDFTMEGANAIGGSTWAVNIPADELTGTVILRPLDDSLVEAPEIASATLISGTGYQIGTPSLAQIGVFDDEPEIYVTNTGNLVEGDPAPATLSFHRVTGGNLPVTIYFTLQGSAEIEKDYVIQGATPVGSGTWSVVVPAFGAADITFTTLDDTQAEGFEVIRAALQPGPGYRVGSFAEGGFVIVDDEPVVSVIANDPSAQETRRKGDWGSFYLSRTGDLSKPLGVFLQLEGTARERLDYEPIPGFVQFAAGKAHLSIPVIPVGNKTAETDRTLTLRLLSSAQYSVDPEKESAQVQIHDDEPTLTLGEVSRKNGHVGVTVVRSGSEDAHPLYFRLVETYTDESGRPVVQSFVLKFPVRAKSMFVPLNRPKQGSASDVSLSLVDGGRFHPGDASPVTFQWSDVN